MSKDFLAKAEEAVKELIEYRDTYVAKFGLDKVPDRKKDLEVKIQETLARLDDAQLLIEDKSRFFFLRGRALNSASAYDPAAVDCLSKAVKLEPALVEAWNELGECYWKNRDIDQARNCFQGAVAKQRNKVSLRNLSMVQRQISSSSFEEKIASIRESIANSKAAVALDVTDGTSWFVLGNAYLSEFFFAGQQPTSLQQSLAAYARAETDRVAVHNPDLYFNRATARKYREDFTMALADFERAALLDVEWAEPSGERKGLVDRLRCTDTAVREHGGLKPKKLSQLLAHIKDIDLGPFVSGTYVSPLNNTVHLARASFTELCAGMNSGRVVNGKIVAVVNVNEPVPFVCVAMDAERTCLAVSIFNLGRGKGPIVGDSIAVPEPFVQDNELDVDGTNVSFRSIRVDNPVVMVINKHKVGPDRLAYSVLSVSNTL